jgi:hypothetical protein
MALQLEQCEKTLAIGGDEERTAILKIMRSEIVDGEPATFFGLAREYVADSNRDVRWQALIVIGEYIATGFRNEEIWSVIVRFCGMDDDMQDALATVLLEHLLEHDFDSTLDRIRDAPPEKLSPVLDLVQRCWRFGQSEAKWHQLLQFAEDHAIGQKGYGRPQEEHGAKPPTDAAEPSVRS